MNDICAIVIIVDELRWSHKAARNLHVDHALSTRYLPPRGTLYRVDWRGGFRSFDAACEWVASIPVHPDSPDAEVIP